MLTLSSAALSATEITRLLLALAVLLGLARLLGEVARRYQQPMVIGEILAGILLGPTVFQYISPGGYQYLFPAAAGEAPSIFVAQESLFMLSAILLLLVAGLEVDLRLAIKHGKAALLVSALGVSAPFVLGFVVAYFAPNFMGSGSDDPAHRVPFGMFVGIAVSITALPVIARILMDLYIFKSDMGMLIMAAAMFNDILGWLVFAVILAMIGGVAGSDAAARAITESGAVAPNGGVEVVANGGSDVMITLGMTVLFLFLMLTAGRWLLHRALVYVQAHWSWPGGVLGLVLVVALVCAAFTEAIGIHAIFGAFVAGIAIGDSRHLRQGTRDTVLQFITNIFAPLFFAGIGVRVNFIADFNPLLVLVVVVIACTGKIGGCFVGAKLSGLTKRESWAIGFGMA
ncbi:MAG: cation:proton antiporter, partial [Phycisphaeraceae bacterium]|nr:cation:proton antiporter [Phycisphaeraceae bacterium]